MKLWDNATDISNRYYPIIWFNRLVNLFHFWSQFLHEKCLWHITANSLSLSFFLELLFSLVIQIWSDNKLDISITHRIQKAVTISFGTWKETLSFLHPFSIKHNSLAITEENNRYIILLADFFREFLPWGEHCALCKQSKLKNTKRIREKEFR